MSWKDDRDALIAQTMAFVQSVTKNSRPQSVDLAVLPASETLHAKSAAPLLAPLTAAEPPPAVPASRPGDVASEIRARIAGFRAHQERFNREREEYFNKTFARLKATLDDMPPRRSD